MANVSVWTKIGTRITPLIYLIFPILNLIDYSIDRPKLEYLLILIIFAIDYITIVFYYNHMSDKTLYTLFLIHYILLDYFVICKQPMNALFFFFSAFAIPFMLKKGFKSKYFITFVIAMIVTLGITFIFINEATLPLSIYFVVIFLMCVGNIYALEERKMKEKLTEQNKYINILIAEQERSRIGQDLHDTLGHVFASLTLKSELAMKLINQQPTKARDEIESINELSKDTLKKVRNIIENLQTPSFLEEVKAVSTILKDAQIDFAFSNTQIVASLNPAKQALVSMILKEAINNIIKHANATEVKINLSDYQNCIILTIQDNGIGMNNKDKEKLGSIRRRVNYLNGELNIENHNGTKLTICVPRGEMM